MRKFTASNLFIIIFLFFVSLSLANAYTTNSTSNSSQTNNQAMNKPLNTKSSETAQAVKKELMADKILKKFSFTVDGYQGMIEVNGVVDTSIEKKRAIEIAQHVHGVRFVSDGVVVKDKK